VVSIGRVSQVVLSPNPKPGFCDRQELSQFQLLAVDVGVSEDELRGLLRRLIAKKLGTPRRVHQCSSCFVEFELSDRRSRDLLAQGEPRCRLCRADVTPGPDIEWMKTLPPDVFEKAVAAMAAIAA
jgi:hypothetical protein